MSLNGLPLNKVTGLGAFRGFRNNARSGTNVGDATVAGCVVRLLQE
ncbi:hypothetical protein GGR01_000497 [Acetobacter oeni]|nr:hypothetical protein [Acetobacter oeni]